MKHAAARRKDAVIAELASLGVTQKRMSALLSIAPSNISVLCRRAGVRPPREVGGWAPHKAKSKERAETMAALYRDGYTLAEIGAQYGITRERVRQLMTRHLGIRATDGGKHKKGADNLARRELEREASMQRRYGCTVDQWEELRRVSREMRAAGRGKYQAPLAAYRCQRNNASFRGIGWELTAWQWWTIWQQSGHWEERGRGFGYVMCRKGDTGPYALGNVFIATGAENSSEGQRKRRVDSGLPIGLSRTAVGTFTVHRAGACLGTYPTIALARAAYLRGQRIEGAIPHSRHKYGLPEGVSASAKGGRYRAYFYEGRRQVHVGCFATVDEAVAARAAAMSPMGIAA